MTIVDQLVDAARVHADRVAIEDAGGETITYRALLERARGFAATVRAGDIVALPARRTPEFLVGCVGAWLAGAAWAPIDPDEPAERGEHVRARLAAARGTPGLAYAIATSGSSGTPKVVLVSHRGLPDLVHGQVAAFALAPGARSLWLHAPVFDASISDWATAFASGATLVIPAPGPVRTELERRAITHVDLPTALLGELTDPPAALRVVVLGGAPCPPERVAALAARLRVVVVYGPTEATVCSSLVVVDPRRWTRPLIGEPIAGISYRVEDGELWIAGDNLAIGYAGDATETVARFVDVDGVRYYRTGDRVEPTSNGLAFVGRTDRQVKLAGGRVELDEVEAALRRCPGVVDAAACVLRPSRHDRERLFGFIEGDAIDVASVRAHLRAALPPWMRPSQLVAGPLPRTATGKVAHTALALPAHSCGGDELASAPRDPLAAELAALWCDALGVTEVSAADRFADRGGDSLAVLSLRAAGGVRGLAIDASGDPTFDELVARVRTAAPELLTVGECEARGLAAASSMSGTVSGGDARACGRDTVLVTGATGLLGTHLVGAWRARDSRRLVALVRGADDAAAGRRCAGVEVVRGDIAAPRFGLATAAWEQLAGRVGTVVHAAAAIRLGDGWDGHAAVNVGGTAEVARFVAASGAAWHHVSTLSVFVGTDDRRARHGEGDLPAAGARAFGGYAATKIAAEAIARAAPATTVLRLGLLTSATPRATDQLAMTIRGLVKLGAVPAGCDGLRFDATPVEYAAVAVVELALRAEAAGEGPAIHHIASVGGATFGALVAAIGRGLTTLPMAAWADRARAGFADPDIAMAYLALARRGHAFDLFLAADFAVERTARLLGVAPPPVELGPIVEGALS